MTSQKLILGLLIWIQTCLTLGVFGGALNFNDWIAIQVSLIMLLIPSPIVQNKKDEDNEH
jgi:hypothetical protein